MRQYQYAQASRSLWGFGPSLDYVKIAVTQAIFRQDIYVGGFDLRTVSAQISVSHIVQHNHQNIGPDRLLRRRRAPKSGLPQSALP